MLLIMCVCEGGFFSFYLFQFLKDKSSNKPVCSFCGILLVFVLLILQIISFILDVVTFPLQLIVKILIKCYNNQFKIYPEESEDNSISDKV